MKLACVLLVVACRGSEPPRDAAPRPRDATAVDAAPAAPTYAIDFPAPTRTRTTPVATTNGSMSQTVESVEVDGTTYMVVSGRMPDGLEAGNKPGGQDRVLAMFGAKSTSDIAIQLGDLAGREVRFTGPANGILRTYAVGAWMIQAGVVARTGGIDQGRASRFFASLQIVR